MSAVQQPPNPRDLRVQRAVRAVYGQQDVTCERAVEPLVGHTRRAAEHDCVFVRGARPGFLTVLLDALVDLIDTGLVAKAAAVAHSAGVAPAVLGAGPEAGAIVHERLPDSFHPLQPHQLRDAEVLRSAVQAKRALHAGPSMPVDRDVFDDVEQWSQLAAAAGAELPVDYTWMRERVRKAGAALRAAGRDARPCHRDGSPSNIMLGPGGQVRLVDFDFAGNADPHHDIAAMLVETCQLDDEWRRAGEQIDGRPDEQRLARYRLNAIADDLAVGSWALLVGARGVGAEYTRYGQWRLLRCRYALQHRNFESWLRRV